MNLNHYTLIIAAFILLGTAGALKTPSRDSHRGLLDRFRYGQMGDAPIAATSVNETPVNVTRRAHRNADCFSALGYTPPSVGSVWETPNIPLDKWRCNIESERGFLGFSYE